MAWTDPKTWTAGSTLTAAELNEQVRDNLTFLKAITDGVDFSGCQIKRESTVQVIPDTTVTVVSFDTENFDYGGWWTSGSDITVPVTAIDDSHNAIMVYVSARAKFETNATGTRRVRVLLNGTAMGSTTVGGLSGDPTEVIINEGFVVEAGDVITFDVRQTSGGSKDLQLLLVNVWKYAPVTV